MTRDRPLKHSANAYLLLAGAMGKVDDPMAVIDSQARVIGVQRLRVVDASSFPFLPPGHPQATVCKYLHVTSKVYISLTVVDALAEKIASNILGSLRG